jgi:acetylornithine deacetylase/succinyl-diaminopimelate desuccinylase-like protein
MFSPTCTISGLTSGYQGPGSKTVLPNKASAKIDCRLVVRQKPEDILKKIKAHFVSHGFSDIEVRPLNFLEAHRTPLSHPLVQVIKKAAELTYDGEIILQPIAAGSGPRYLFENILGLSMVSDCGSANRLSAHHAPNEHIRVDDYLDNIVHMAHVYNVFSKHSGF